MRAGILLFAASITHLSQISFSHPVVNADMVTAIPACSGTGAKQWRMEGKAAGQGRGLLA